ncbi:MAG: N-acetylmuramoyl-L-alanine amidase [Cohnella sp.]|nr:N-acetylmuramoyl-L-alanine amidase [Cohnella sp.]
MRRVLLVLIAAVMLIATAGWTYPPNKDIDTGHAAPPDIYWAIPSADVLIDAGHGGIDGGTHWGHILEKDINLAIARKLYLLLRSQGVRAVLNRTGDYALSDENRWHAARSRHRRDLSQRRGLSDEIDAALFVSIHVNWAARGGKGGPLVLHRNEGRSAILAAFVQDSLNRLQGRSRLPRGSAKLYLLNRVKAPSVIIETAFLNNTADREMLTSRRGQTRIAEAIASGIMAYRYFAP